MQTVKLKVGMISIRFAPCLAVPSFISRRGLFALGCTAPPCAKMEVLHSGPRGRWFRSIRILCYRPCLAVLSFISRRTPFVFGRTTPPCAEMEVLRSGPRRRWSAKSRCARDESPWLGLSDGVSPMDMMMGGEEQRWWCLFYLRILGGEVRVSCGGHVVCVQWCTQVYTGLQVYTGF